MTKHYIKFIQKSGYKEDIEKFLEDLTINNIDHYDIKKIKNHTNLYRVRIGKVRCLFQKIGDQYEIVDINMRGDIYKNL